MGKGVLADKEAALRLGHSRQEIEHKALDRKHVRVWQFGIRHHDSAYAAAKLRGGLVALIPVFRADPS